MILKRGDRGQDVARLRRLLAEAGFPAVDTGPVFDEALETAVRAFQASRGLKVDGIAGSRETLPALEWDRDRKPERVTMPDPLDRIGDVAFVPAVNYLYVPGGRTDVRWIVIHTAEVLEVSESAEAVARFFATQRKIGTILPDGSKVKKGSSAHYTVDVNTIVQSVREEDVAYHVGGGNRLGIGIEHAGYARQTVEDWDDDYSAKMLDLSARLVARICRRWAIPVVKIGPRELQLGIRGICGHVDVTRAFAKSDHTDPGSNFPWARYLQKIAELI